MTAAIATRPAAIDWTRRRLPSGVWRCAHRNGSVVFIGRDVTEAEIQRRLAVVEATIRHLERKRC